MGKANVKVAKKGKTASRSGLRKSNIRVSFRIKTAGNGGQRKKGWGGRPLV